MKPLTPIDLWWRVGIGVMLIVLGAILQAGTVSLVLVALGVGWIVWAVIRGVLQVRRAEAIERGRRER